MNTGEIIAAIIENNGIKNLNNNDNLFRWSKSIRK